MKYKNGHSHISQQDKPEKKHKMKNTLKHKTLKTWIRKKMVAVEFKWTKMLHPRGETKAKLVA